MSTSAAMLTLLGDRQAILTDLETFKYAPGRCDALRRKLVATNELIAQEAMTPMMTERETANVITVLQSPSQQPAPEEETE